MSSDTLNPQNSPGTLTTTVLVGASALLGCAFYFAAILSWMQALGLPLLVLGLFLTLRQTHWGLCYAAFAIGPFGVVQAEVLGVTLNLPEVLILALAAKEGLRALRTGSLLPPALPVRVLAVFILAATIALATGFVQQNGAVRVLQDFRQFTEFLVLFWLVLHSVAGRDEALRIAASYAAGASLLAVHGIVQQLVPVGISETQISSDLVLHHGIRSGSFYGATTLGGIMVLAVAPAAGVALSSRRRALQVLMGLCIVLCLFAIVFTRTRGSWLGLGVALLLLGVSIRPSGKTLAAVACAGMALALVLGPLVVQRLYTLADPEQDISLMARAQYYAAAARIGQAHPLLGLGWGCYYDIDAILQAEHYVETSFQEAEEEGPNDRNEPEGEATVHSAYLQLFVKTGALGLAAFLAIIVVWMERVWRGRNTRFQTDTTHALYIGISAGIAGYLFHSTFENFFQWPVMAQSFWLLLGLSFVLAPKADVRPRYGVPAGFVCGAVAVFLIFMYACMRLETLHTDHYQRNVAKALEEGNLDKAIHIAHRATEVELYEPMPFTVYARVLLMKGDVAGAFAALETSVGTTRRPPAPQTRYTGPRYYFAPARLTLGRYYAEQGTWDRALHEFELARAYADLTSEEFAEFHPVLYKVYSTRGRWDRALDFGAPDSTQLSTYPPATLLSIARVFAAKEDWHSVVEYVSAVEAMGDTSAESHYLQGRALLEFKQANEAVARLEKAPAIPEAAFYLGLALEADGQPAEAVRAWQSVPATSPFYPVALSYAWARAQDSGDTATASATLAKLKDALRSLSPLPGDAVDGRKLSTFALSAGAIGSESAIPALFLWDLDQPDLEKVTGATVQEAAGEHRIGLTGTGGLLQLRRVENRLPWLGVERAYPTDSVLAGWIDTTRDWFDLRDNASAERAVGEDEDPALLLDRMGWIVGLPARIPATTTCLLTARFRDAAGHGRMGWQSLDANNLVLHDGALAEREALPEWAPRAALVPPKAEREVVRVVVESVATPSAVFADDLCLIELAPPALDSAP